MKRSNSPYVIHIIEGDNLKKLLLQFQDLILKYFGSIFEKLLDYTLNGWISLNLLPDGMTLQCLRENISDHNLTSSEIAFLWTSYLFSKGLPFIAYDLEKNQPLQYNYESLYDTLIKFSNCQDCIHCYPITKVNSLVIANPFQFETYVDMFGAKLIININGIDIPAFYSIVSDGCSSGVEVMIIQNHTMETKIHSFSENIKEIFLNRIDFLNSIKCH